MYVPSIFLTMMRVALTYTEKTKSNNLGYMNLEAERKETEAMSELLEKILSDENMKQAQKRVYANKGASGVDGITVQELEDYLKKNWASIKEDIRERKYKPEPVLRVEIPKPGGGMRKLGIPTVVDRTIQQAMVQVLSPMFEPTFCENSYGFRPNRSCEQAILKLLDYFNEGYLWVVDIDLEKFFDNVPQDKLMSFAHRVIDDGDTESLIRKFLKAGVMVNGLYEATELGTPQGGNLSPLLSNVMLNELDKELEKRGLRFTRYADDCVIVVGSETSAKRVMYSITSWIERKLGLKVNATKTQITKPTKLKYLGFGFWKSKDEWRARPHQDSVLKFKRKLKELCKRNWSIDLTYRIGKINQLTRGWINYFSMADMKSSMKSIDEHLRTMMRIIIWKQWKVFGKRVWGLKKLGLEEWRACEVAMIGDRYQLFGRMAQSKKISKEILTRRGLVSIEDYYLQRHALKVN